MTFLEGEMDDDGDGFLDGELDDEGSFLEGIDEQEPVPTPPPAYSCTNKRLINELWDDRWHDITDEKDHPSSNMKTFPCGGCGYSICVARSVRSFTCWKCGAVNVDFEWDDTREEKQDYDRSNLP